MGFSLTDIISINDFSKQDIDFVLEQSAAMEKMPAGRKREILPGKIVAPIFFEPSTRTRLSFETAIHNLGANAVGFAEASSSSTVKGESLSDSIRIISSYADIIVIRHPRDGSARRAAEISKKPVINAGDGSNQHPTQTLLDLYTIKKEFGKIDGLKIGMIGDLKHGRTVHSLSVALSNYSGIKLFFASPENLKMPEEIVALVAGKLQIEECSAVKDFVSEADVLYCTRVQKERFFDLDEYNRAKDSFVVGKEILEKTKKGFRIMHPLPRVNEIKQELDGTEAAIYFEQAANGVPVREAILSILNGAEKK